jgi:peptidyl-prolyl cis-trans isomerase D
MLGTFRKLANTFVARVFFFLLAAAFVGWGVAGRLNGSGDASAVATVEGHSITAQEFDQAFKDDLLQAAQRLPDPTQIPQVMRDHVAQQTLERLTTQQALDDEAHRLGIVAPEQAIQDEIRGMKAFQGISGSFDHREYVQVLSQHNLTPQRFQTEVSMDVAKNQILHAVTAGAQPSALLTNLVFDYLYEGRTADLVLFNFAGQKPPAAPTDAVLQRYADNNAARYTSPEYRKIKAVILSPETIGRSLPVSDADMHAWFNLHKEEFQAPEKRSLEVITASTEAAASALAAKWKAGASWDAMQAAAPAQQGTATSLKDTTKAAIPAPELAQAAFAAAPNTVVGPIKEPLGYQLVVVTAVTPAKNPSFDELKDTIRKRVGAERAVDLVDERAQKLQDLFAGGNHIDEVPADIGAAGVQGTTDAKGNTPDGGKAPIPAPDDVKALLIADAFKASKSDTGQLVEGPNHVWYAVAVQDVIKPAVKPFASVRAQVLADWQQAQIRHSVEVDAAHLLAEVKGGQMLATASWGSGHQVIRTPKLVRNQGAKGIPAQLTQLIFTLKPHEATMVQTDQGFMVAQLADIIRPDPKADADEMANVRHGLGEAWADDLLVSYGTAVRDAAKPGVNTQVFEKLVQPQGE